MVVEEDYLKRLMVASQDGDKAAYQDLLNILSPMFKRFVIRLGIESIDADDVVQNALIAIHNARHTYQPSRPFLAWAFSITQKKSYDYFNQRKRAVSREINDNDYLEKVMSDIAQTMEEVQERERQYTDVVSSLEKLPEPQRTIIRFLKLEGFSVKQVAGKLKMTESAIKTSAHRGYKRLKNIFESTVDHDVDSDDKRGKKKAENE